MISYEIKSDNCIIVWLSKESKPRPRLKLKFDNHLININGHNGLRHTYLVYAHAHVLDL